MRIRLGIILCVCVSMLMTLAGCGETATDNTISTEKMPLICESEIGLVYNPQALYAYRLLHYEDKMYTSIEIYQETDKEALSLDTYVEKEIGTVSGNHYVFWSTDAEELSVADCEGVLYELKDYDTSSRLGIYYENVAPSGETYYQLVVFEYHNDDIYTE